MTNLPQNQNRQVQASPVNRLKDIMASPSVAAQFKNALAENAPLFIASIIDLYASDTYLQRCDPGKVIAECLKAATLKLPINKSLGFAYVVPYKNVPQFQIGYKGLLQLALRTGQYRRLNDGTIFEGQEAKTNPITGDIEIAGEATSDTPIGFFAYFQLANGFEKSIYLTADQARAHGKKFSASYGKDSSPWKTNFEAMAIKTCWKKILSKYGIMSVEMVNVMANDDQAPHETDYQQNANHEFIDIETVAPDGVDPETGEISGSDSLTVDMALAGEQSATTATPGRMF